MQVDRTVFVVVEGAVAKEVGNGYVQPGCKLHKRAQARIATPTLDISEHAFAHAHHIGKFLLRKTLVCSTVAYPSADMRASLAESL